MKKSLLTGVLLLGVAGCGQAAPGITGQPAASSPDMPAVTTLAELPVSERIAALARIPTMRTQRLNAIFDALALRHPEDAEALNQVRSRMLALDETGIKALRAALWQDMKDRSVEEVHLEFLAMIDKPSRLVSLLDAKLDALALNDSNKLELRVYANEEVRHAVLLARLDNLGKGASGAAVQNIELMLGL